MPKMSPDKIRQINEACLQLIQEHFEEHPSDKTGFYLKRAGNFHTITMLEVMLIAMTLDRPVSDLVLQYGMGVSSMTVEELQESVREEGGYQLDKVIVAA